MTTDVVRAEKVRHVTTYETATCSTRVHVHKCARACVHACAHVCACVRVCEIKEKALY